MPELSEVEFTKSLLEDFLRNSAGKDDEKNGFDEIEEIELMDDSIVLKEFDNEDALLWKKAEIMAVKRYGKYFWIEATTRIGMGESNELAQESKRQYLMMHLGMTGCMRIKKQDKDNQFVKLQSNIKYDADEWPPRHVKMIIRKKGKLEMDEIAFCDPRRLGRIKLIKDIDPRDPNEGYLKHLGFDPIHNMPDSERFQSILSLKESSKAPLKSLLLNQSFNAGIGNWMADEICYQAKLSPLQRIDQLCMHPKEIENLRKAIEYVSTFAVSVQANSTKYPKSWLFHQRWDKKLKHKRAKKSDTDEERKRKVVFEKVGGRTTASIPNEQPIIS
jgi:formamidopyrimidine-DNA glycosylase